MNKTRRNAAAALVGIVLVALPAPADWGRIDLVGAEVFGVDQAHSSIGFTIGFLGVTKVRGSFRSYVAAILFDEKDPTRSSATVVIDAGSIDTGLESRDKDLKGPKFFEVEKYPKIVFTSRSVEKTGPDRYVVRGTLEIRGIAREIAIPMTQTVPRMADTAWGNMRVGGEGAVRIKRTDFGILGGEFWGAKALSDEVDIEISLLGNRFNFDKWSFNYTFGADQVSLVANRLLQHRRLPEALALFELAAAEWPKEAVLHARVGECHAAMGNRGAALAAYKKALEISPRNPEALEMIRRLEK